VSSRPTSDEDEDEQVWWDRILCENGTFEFFGQTGRRREPHCGQTVLLPRGLIPTQTGATAPSSPPEQNLRQSPKISLKHQVLQLSVLFYFTLPATLICDIATAAGHPSSQPSQPPRLDPCRLNRVSSDEPLEVYRESHHDLKAVVDRLLQRTVENVPNAAPVDLAAPKTAASTSAQCTRDRRAPQRFRRGDRNAHLCRL
jgi:hypothetical protein